MLTWGEISMQDFINQKELTTEIFYENITRIEHYPFPKDAVREKISPSRNIQFTQMIL